MYLAFVILRAAKAARAIDETDDMLELLRIQIGLQCRCESGLHAADGTAVRGRRALRRRRGGTPGRYGHHS